MQTPIQIIDNADNNERVDYIQRGINDRDRVITINNLGHTQHDLKLNELLLNYRMFCNHGAPGTTLDMYIALCTFLHLELQLFIKVKHFYDSQVDVLPQEQLSANARAIRDEFPVSKFNEILMEYFDACMASNEGNVQSATRFTKAKFANIKTWLYFVDR